MCGFLWPPLSRTVTHHCTQQPPHSPGRCHTWHRCTLCFRFNPGNTLTKPSIFGWNEWHQQFMDTGYWDFQG